MEEKVIFYKLDAFEGPLDLLLHLIEKNKIDIYDIPISEITEQYLEYMKALEEEDLEIVSAFLLMDSDASGNEGQNVTAQEGGRGRGGSRPQRRAGTETFRI